jgi:transcriptional regulator with GAF, ATPase, and Fis domain
MLDLQLTLWREASRAADLPEAVARMTTLLARRVPIGRVFVRRFDPAAEELDTVAVGQVQGGPAPAAVQTPCTRGQLAELRTLAGAGVVMLNGSSALTGAVVPKGVRGPVAAGPLLEPGGVVAGVFVATLQPGAELGDAARADLGRSLEPFAVALAHHRRVHDLERQREAAEAEKAALLTRLHRREIVEEIVGADGSLRAVMTRVEQVAPTDAPVLILGETGTGKEVVARAIHARSARADGPIVRVNCGAIPPELVDSELFGHEKGAFTGALATRKGWFERADGGTLFLDEVGELPPAAQVRLLRILQDGSYERVGGQQTRVADVRILAATHRDMEALVGEGRFREDLWYRISVFPLYLPPLRSRREDIPALAHHFARAAGLRLGSGPLVLDAEDLQVLLAYPWPGNVRELAAVIERAAILGGGHRLDVRGAMGTKLHALQERIADAPPYGPPQESGAFPALDDAMRQHIEAALRRCGGRVEGPNGAAALLGINPYTLRGRMRKLGVHWQRFRAG